MLQLVMHRQKGFDLAFEGIPVLRNNFRGNLDLEPFPSLYLPRRRDFIDEVASTTCVFTQRYFDNLSESNCSVPRRDMHFLRYLDVPEVLRVQQ